MLNVGKIEEGFVLDHIKAGKSLSIYHHLQLDKLDCTVAIIKNARSGKMGKSEGNCIYLIDDEKTLRKKVMRAVTDEGPKVPDSEPTEPIRNLFTLMELVSAPDTLGHFRSAYADCSIRYGDLKKQLAEDILAITTPIRERVNDILADEAYISRVVREGAEKAARALRKHSPKCAP